MSVTRSLRNRWLSARAVGLHLAVLIAVPTCIVATWWQVDRAVSGNTLSWAYTFEWPAFAGLAVWAWWVLLHLPDRDADCAPGAAAMDASCRPLKPKQAARQRLLEQRRSPLRWAPALEGPRLRQYNAYLAQLQSVSPSEAKRIPRPRGGGRD